MEDWRVITGLAGFVMTMVVFALTRADKSHKKTQALEHKTHENELSISHLRCEIAREYVTKSEMRELKDFITTRFDRLETKLEGNEK